MNLIEMKPGTHPDGEVKRCEESPLDLGASGPFLVDTEGGRYHVEWDEGAPVTPLGQLVFFAQFLQANELFSGLCADAPFEYKSNNAPEVRDVLGSLLLSVLSGHNRYAHMAALRNDTVTPALLGMSKIVSEDSARRSLGKMNQTAARSWGKKHLRACWEPLLYEPWVLDIDTTIKQIYGKQEGAAIGYNPQKPGRPSHSYHTYSIGRIRIVLDVEVCPGNKNASCHGMPGLWELIDSLPRHAWPQFIRGDCNYGTEGNMKEAEARGLGYLFKLKKSKNVKELLLKLESMGGWVDAGKGFEGAEGFLQLDGWSAKRRVIALRRRIKSKESKTVLPLLEQAGIILFECQEYQYMVLVTNLSHTVAACAQLYRDRGDCENPFDELKNQWGWSGFTTHDFERSQIMARYIALIYNWWSLFVRLLSPHQHSEAITSRPMMLSGVARQTQHAGQKKLSITLNHGKSVEIKEMVAAASSFLKNVIDAAEQLAQPERWRLILSRIFVNFLDGRILCGGPQAVMSG